MAGQKLAAIPSHSHSINTEYIHAQYYIALSDLKRKLQALSSYVLDIILGRQFVL